MLSVLSRGIIISVVSWVLWRIVRPLVVKSPLDNIPGPPPKSSWRGHLPELFSRHGWGLQDNIDKEGKAVVKLIGMFNKPSLYVFDPKALQHIILKDQQVYERASFSLAFTRLSFGSGLLTVLGERHRQQRKMLNPVFSINHMRHMTPIFYQTAHRLCKAINGQIKNSGNKEIDMLNWMGRTALELVGQGGLGYSFDPLVADTQNSFGEAIKAFLPTVGLCWPYRIFASHHDRFGTPSLRRRLVELFPDPNVQALRKIIDTMEIRAKEILESKRAALRAGDTAVEQQVGEGKDIMSILLKSNMATDSVDRLTEEELVAQMSTLVFAATDTTSNGLSRILDLLTTHKDVQEKLRAEILEAGQGQDISYDQLVELPYLDAVCRETLRLYPPVPFVYRETRKDMVLPLSQPVDGIDGTTLNEIIVPKDTLIFVSIRSCNRNKAIWGEDALEWKPERWLSSAPAALLDAKIPGVYANLMTFLGGGNSCIGFKFSQLEMKVILAALLSSFNFNPTNKEVYWNNSDVVYPTVGPDNGKASMPLAVQPISNGTVTA